MRKHITHSLLSRIGQDLRTARSTRRLTQQALGERVGLPQSHISKIERGDVDLQLSSLAELARALGLEVRLVPRTALPAIDGVIGSFTSDQTARRVADLLQDKIHIAEAVLAAYPELEAAQRFRQSLAELAYYPLDPAAVLLVEKTLKPTSRLVDHLSQRADPARIADILDRMDREIRPLRNAIAHGRPTRPAQIPALSLDEHDDD